MAARPAGAYPQDPNNCNDRTITWHFDSAWNAHPNARGWAREAIGLWNQPRDYNGNQLMVVSESTSSGVSVQLRHTDPDVYGSSECVAGASFWINSQHITSKTFVRKVSRHEMGHLLGMEHTGRYDSTNGDNPPTMSTCVDRSKFLDQNILSQDDAAYANWLHGSLANRQLHANIGFEQGPSYWG